MKMILADLVEWARDELTLFKCPCEGCSAVRKYNRWLKKGKRNGYGPPAS